MTIGFAFGLLGESLHLFLSQQKLSIIMGVGLLTYFVLSKRTSSYTSAISEKLYRRVQDFFHTTTLPKYYILGFSNGFLPCGMVYLAAMSAASTGHLSKSLGWMLGFGIGTIPSLSFILWLGKILHTSSNRFYSIITRYFSILIAILLILRGLNLGIPYLSPHLDPKEEKAPVVCHG